MTRLATITGARTIGARLGAVAGGALIVVSMNASPAGAAVTIGETFATAPGQCNTAAVFIQSTSAPAPAVQYAAPSAGVITSWSKHGGATVPPFTRLKVLRPAGGLDFATVGRSELEVPAAGVPNTFATRVPVQAGDLIGYFNSGGNHDCARALAGATVSVIVGDPPVGSTAAYNAIGPNFQLNLSARLEPDADNDGFGDETQDLCPTDAETVKACRDKTAPETTITKQPKKKSKSKKADFQFISSEAGSTFRCSLDGGAFDLCTSPKSYNVKPGKHGFTVVAKDAAGNIDETPATATWTVRKKKRK